MKKKILFITTVLLCLTLPISALAHSGRTDAAGGHKDNKNVSGLGAYHYHCGGNPAHLHYGGICPYDIMVPPVTTPTIIKPLPPNQPIHEATSSPLTYTIKVNGNTLNFNHSPYEENGFIMVPMRDIFESLGAEIDWQEQQQKAVINLKCSWLEITANSDQALQDGIPVSISPVATINNNITFVPLRFVSESLGATVDYDATNHTVTITQ